MSSNPEGRWKVYDEQVRAFVQIHNPAASARRLLEEAVALFEAKGGAVYLQQAGAEHLEAVGAPSDAPELVIPLEHQGRPLGLLALGARRNGRPYSPHDRQLLRGTADAVAAAIAIVGTKDTHV